MAVASATLLKEALGTLCGFVFSGHPCKVGLGTHPALVVELEYVAPRNHIGPNLRYGD